MDEFTKLSWWVGFLGASFFYMLVRDYVWPPINRWLSSVSTKWRARSAAEIAARAERVAAIGADKHEQLLLLGDETRARLHSILFLLFSILFLVLYIITVNKPSELASPRIEFSVWLFNIAYWASFILMLLFLWMHTKAIRYRRLLSDARNLKRR